MIKTKYNSEYQAIIDAVRLSDLSDDKNFLGVYESSNAQIFPYQIMAARFALRSDYLKGCILCDEASLGKTYEALLVVCQKWFEGNENILIILPANLLTQWFRKLEKDFPTVPYVFWNNTKTIPDETGIIITTYDTAIRHAERIKERDWDIVVFDEADVLSRSENKSVQILKEAVNQAFKLLLTPTPITKSIMDIYWLIHFIDESVLPDSDWFYKRYFRRPENYHELTNWVSQFCFRTLKCQTTDYVSFTRRIPITINYQLSKEEKDLYKLVSAYIISDDKAAYPELDSYNLNLLLFKSLSSSPDAFSKLLDNPINRAYGHEKAVLEELKELTNKIKVNSKTIELLKILKTVFNHLKAIKVKKKAVIFAENSVTLDYLYRVFSCEGYNVIKYKDIESIEEFRFFDEKEILIADDEAAKGIDLEFCPVIVNYDLPYDSIKIEQRICRCHRQGQNSDVLVINMLSKENFADVRILELINKRTLQFNGIFGMSDDIVGNFDTKIKEVLQNFRHSNDVAQSFNENLSSHKETNEETAQHAEDILFTTFSKSVIEKLSVEPKYIEDKIEEINNTLWNLVKYYFTEIKTGLYNIDDENRVLTLKDGIEKPYLFSYRDDERHKKHCEGYQKYGINKDFRPERSKINLTSVIGKGILNEIDKIKSAEEAKIYIKSDIEPVEICFYHIAITSLGLKDRVYNKSLLTGKTKSGKELSQEECLKILELPISKIETRGGIDTIKYGNLLTSFISDDFISEEQILEDYFKRKESSIEYEIEKLKMTAGRKKAELEADLKELRMQVETMKKQLTNKNTDRLEELKLTKELKIKQKELMEREEHLFFNQAQVDTDTEKQISELTNKYNFKVHKSLRFRLQFYPSL